MAYISAVAAHAGYQVSVPQIDRDSIDGILLADIGRRPRIEFQAKATAATIGNQNDLAFDLSIKNYNDLRAEVILPRLLIVVVVPEHPAEWLDQDAERLCLKRCGYWLSLAGEPERENKTKVRVSIPRQQRFDTAALLKLMQQAQEGGL